MVAFFQVFQTRTNLGSSSTELAQTGWIPPLTQTQVNVLVYHNILPILIFPLVPAKYNGSVPQFYGLFARSKTDHTSTSFPF